MAKYVDAYTHAIAGDSTIVVCSTICTAPKNPRRTTFNFGVSSPISVPPCSNTNSHGLASSSPHTKSLLPSSLIDSSPESNIVRRKTRQRLRIVGLPRIPLLRNPFTKHGMSIFTVKHLNPVAITCNVRHTVLDVPLGVYNSTILVVAEERLPPQLSSEQISNDRESVDHPLRVTNNTSRVINVHFSLLSQGLQRSLRRHHTKCERWHH